MILTPRGITIYLSKEYAFGLMARIYPDVNPFLVLEKTQGIYRIHSATGFLVGMICFVFSWPPLNIGLVTFSSIIIAFLMRINGIFFIPGIIVFPTIYSRYTGYGIYYVILLITGFLTVGILGTLVFFIARVLAEGLTILIENSSGKKIGYKLGADPIVASNGAMYFAATRDFFNAYRIYALKYGASIDLKLADDELKISNWLPVWEDLQRNWPAVANRFTEEK